MAQLIKQGNIFGRIGSGIGKGLAEQVPKEIERSRLSSALQELGNKKGQTPFQQYAGLVGAAHEYPQVVQSGAELLKQQGVRDAYSRNRGMPQNQGQGQPNINDIRFANTQPGQQQSQKFPNAEDFNTPQIQQKNEIRQEAIPTIPATPQQRVNEMADLQEQFPNLSFPEIQSMWEQNEANRLASPQAHQAQDEFLKNKRNELNDNFTKHLEELTQKTGPEVFKDVTGESLGRIKAAMDRELRENPKANINAVGRKWANRALDFAKAKNDLKGLGSSSLFATPILLNKEGYRNKLKAYGDIYKKAGNEEEFYNTLQSDFLMSPQGAASLTYDPSKEVSKLVSSYKPTTLGNVSARNENARKLARELKGKINSNDSVLAIARSLNEKDANFDQTAFFEELGLLKDEMGLTERQRREIGKGPQMLPSWGDVLILPFFRGL